MLVFSNIKKLYDGKSSEKQSVHKNVDLFIKNDKIEKFSPHSQSKNSYDGYKIIDASGFIITPGIIDCHGHVTLLGLSPKQMDRVNEAQALLYVEKILYTTLVDGGVTSMRDIGGATALIRDLINDGELVGPRLKIAISMLSSTGGHGDFRGLDRCHSTLSKLWPEGPGRPSGIVDGPWECRKRVREVAACGADLIKICTSPGIASPGDKLEHREFTGKEIEAICDEAAGRGLRVAAHAHSASGIELAIKYGVHDIQHISFMDDKLAEMAAKAGCTVTPTTWILNELEKTNDITDFVRGKLKQVLVVHKKAIKSALKYDLKILSGSDPVIAGMHGKNYMELVTLSEMGLSSLQAWFSSTGLAASEIGMENTGKIAEGYLADLIVHNADVIETPTKLSSKHMVEVIKSGVGYKGSIASLEQYDFSSFVKKSLERIQEN